MNIHFLGTAGGGRVHPDRFCASIAFETTDGLYMFDIGEPGSSMLMRNGLEPRRVRAAFVTHWHRDHVNGLMGLMGHMKHGKILVPLPEHMMPWLEGMHRLACMPYKIEPDVSFEPIAPGKIYDDTVIRVEAIENSHFRQLLVGDPDVVVAPGELKSLSFAIEYRNLRIVYSGDVGDARDIEPLLEKPVDLLIIEGAHILPLSKSLEFLQEAQVRNIVITHIWHEITSDNTEIAESVKATIHDRVWAAHDGMCVRFKLDENKGRMEVIPGAEVRRRAAKTALWGVQKVNALAEKGIPQTWWLLGPMENPVENGEFVGLLRDYGIKIPLVEDEVYVGKGKRLLRWQRIGTDDIDIRGGVDLGLLLGGTECLGFATTKLNTPADGKYRFLMGSDDGLRVWLDGEEVYFMRGPRAAMPEQDEFVVDMKKGEHDVLVAIDQHYGGWMFYFRVVPVKDESG